MVFDSLTDASTLLLAFGTTAEFVSALVITGECLKYLLGLTWSLQAEANDIVHAVSEINSVKAALSKCEGGRMLTIITANGLVTFR